MRRKSSSQGGGGFNNQQRKQNFRQGGGGQNHSNRPRKNYAAAREKYLQQARDALASGDRVLAENYYQHADHCYRMMVEEGYNFRNNHHQQQGGAPATGEVLEVVEDTLPANVSQLPAFLNTAVIADDTAGKEEPPQAAVGWEE